MFGVLNLAVAFIVMEAGSSIFEMCIKVIGVVASPMAGVMMCAVVLPFLDTLVRMLKHTRTKTN